MITLHDSGTFLLNGIPTSDAPLSPEELLTLTALLTRVCAAVAPREEEVRS